MKTLALCKNVQKILPLNQVKSLMDLSREGEKELERVLLDLDKQLAEIPDYTTNISDQTLIRAHYFVGGSDWYVMSWDRKNNIFFGFVVLNNDLQMAETGDFSFKQLDEITDYSKFLLINLDFYWENISFRKLKQQLGFYDAEEEINDADEPESTEEKESETGVSLLLSTNLMLEDAFFQQYPENVLGEITEKKRGDRGENKFETIIVGKISNALAKIIVPEIPAYTPAIKEDDALEVQERALAEAKAIALALEIELELMI